ncbi:MAG: hypothetical protein QY326_03590 [Bdellovibrionota bacterium]|nr:MAG: hypothetical protein QY326_03590 [Bdellovibrionota bacterium]
MTFAFQDPALNVRESLEAFIELLLRKAQICHIPLTKGVSFGFSCPRISAAAAMAEASRPFLRLAVGDGGESCAAELTELIIDSALEYRERIRRLM